jgi:hypothetical protein
MTGSGRPAPTPLTLSVEEFRNLENRIDLNFADRWKTFVYFILTNLKNLDVFLQENRI